MRSLLAASMFALAVVAFTTRPAGAADTFNLDSVHSALVFKVKHLNVSYSWGMLNSPTGRIVWDSADPTRSTFEISAKVENIHTANAKRDNHLRSPDFFDGRQFPNITFKSTAVKPAGENKYEVSGDLTIRGNTRPITVTLEHFGTVTGPQGRVKTGFDGSFTINRQDFGVSYMPEGIGNEVTIFVALEADKQ